MRNPTKAPTFLLLLKTVTLGTVPFGTLVTLGTVLFGTVLVFELS